jgi:pyruvate formate lyase activating enzyme
MTIIAKFHPTKYWHKLENGKIQCDLCPRNCKLQEGQRGICFVRMCLDKKIVLTTYGLASSVCIDPIEKKPLNHFLPGSTTYSFGTIGCNLLCKHCQNWDISKPQEANGLIHQADPASIAKAAQTYQCKSISFTYNEPIISMEYAIDTWASKP